MNVGTFFVPVNQTWFLFYRQYGTIPSPASCTKEKKDVAKIVMTWSEDLGKTWHQSIDVALPNPSNEYEDCAQVSHLSDSPRAALVRPLASRRPLSAAS